LTNKSYKAVLFDVDGTLAETEAEGHLPAFNEAFVQLGIPWSWSHDLYGRLLEITGGFERMQHYARQQGYHEWLTEHGLDRLRQAHRLKNELYAQRLRTGLVQPRVGLAEFMVRLQAEGIPWAVVTTTSQSNWKALWLNCLRPVFASEPLFAICGEDVVKKKPDPEAYLQGLERLGLDSESVVAIEDSPNGLQSAKRAGMSCLVVRSIYFQDVTFEGALAVMDDYLEIGSVVGLGANQ
jgi:HAD superfamily hydrolase (TIGR01509 family)